MWAVQQGNDGMMMLLLDRDAKIDIADKVSYSVCTEYVIDGKDGGYITGNWEEVRYLFALPPDIFLTT